MQEKSCDSTVARGSPHNSPLKDSYEKNVYKNICKGSDYDGLHGGLAVSHAAQDRAAYIIDHDKRYSCKNNGDIGFGHSKDTSVRMHHR